MLTIILSKYLDVSSAFKDVVPGFYPFLQGLLSLWEDCPSNKSHDTVAIVHALN